MKEKMIDIKFEDALKKLEEIVEKLEAGELPLESSLKQYEEGVKLVRLCSDKLKKAEKRIEILQKKDGKFKLAPFEEESESE